MNDRTDHDEQAGRIPRILLTVGTFGRVIITTLVALPVSGTADFIEAWITVKTAGGRSSWSRETRLGRAVFSIGLLCDAMSIFFALVGDLMSAQR